MGLDMYAFRTKADIPSVNFDHPEDTEQFFYWRKHPNLHGWMEALYFTKGGIELFNCEFVKIELADLDVLEAVVNGDTLPQTAGFFFGASEAEDKIDDLDFIAKARESMTNGYSVYYSSWW